MLEPITLDQWGNVAVLFLTTAFVAMAALRR